MRDSSTNNSSGYDSNMITTNRHDQVGDHHHHHHHQEYNKFIPPDHGVSGISGEREYNNAINDQQQQSNNQNNPSSPTSIQTKRPSSSQEKQIAVPEEEEEIDVIPPSPPPAPPSGLTVALARLSDLTSQIEFQYAKYVQMTKEHHIIKAKIEMLKELPVGIDAIREDLDKLEEEENAKKKSA